MNLTKKNLLTKLSTIGTTITLLMIKNNICFATGIGTHEVEAATDNIQRVIIDIAMPLRRTSNLWMHCYSSIQDDCKCE